jgi:hypothetical protein
VTSKTLAPLGACLALRAAAASAQNPSRDAEASLQPWLWQPDRPLSAPGTMRTVWLEDPDGISNYFAKYSGNDNTPPERDGISHGLE